MSPWPGEPALSPVPRAPLSVRTRQRLARWLGAPRATAFVLPEQVWDYTLDAGRGRLAPQPLPDVPAWLATHPGQPLQIVLSSRCSKSLLIDAQASGVGRGDRAGIEALARAQLLQVWGADAAAWPLRTWSGRRWHGACAWVEPRGSDGLDASARVRQVRPWWSVALQRLASQHPGWGESRRSALLLCEGVHLLWLVADEGEIVVLRQRRLAEATLAALAAFALQTRAEDAVDAASTHVLGYGLLPMLGTTFQGEQVEGTLVGTIPEAAWLTV